MKNRRLLRLLVLAVACLAALPAAAQVCTNVPPAVGAACQTVETAPLSVAMAWACDSGAPPSLIYCDTATGKWAKVNGTSLLAFDLTPIYESERPPCGILTEGWVRYFKHEAGTVAGRSVQCSAVKDGSGYTWVAFSLGLDTVPVTP